MKLHRFYVNDTDLTKELWLRDAALFHQWTKVLRFQVDREVALFDNQCQEKLYRITKISSDTVHLELITEMAARTSYKNIYLCFSLLKKDKNDWVLQKGTELGVKHFVPLLCDRTEKTGFDAERAEKIIIEASEQCGRADIPRVREPITPQKIIDELEGEIPVLVAEQSDRLTETNLENIAVLIGPEGGWSDKEKAYFKTKNLPHFSISEFTLRAETAAIAAAALLQ